MTTTYRLGGASDGYVCVTPRHSAGRLYTPAEARRLADEYEAAVPQLRALADQAEANAREAIAKREAEIAIALREPGAFRHGDRVYMARLDKRECWRLWRLIVHESGRVVTAELPEDLEVASIPVDVLPPIWGRNEYARTAHLYRGGDRYACGKHADWRICFAGKAKPCATCSAIQDAGRRVEEAP